MTQHDFEIGEEIGRQIKAEHIDPLNVEIDRLQAELERVNAIASKRLKEIARLKAMGTYTPEKLAQEFHETYERLATNFGYTTRKSSAVAWEDVPEPNKSLMIAVAAEILKWD